MTTMTSSGIASWPGRAEAWLDDRGKPAWIATMILGFIFFWPVGLALLGYMIWSRRMFSRSNNNCGAGRWNRTVHRQHGVWASSGNSAFDAYKTETLRRLEEEQQAFDAFLQRLRDARDKQEFDAFMQDRAKGAQAPAPIQPPEAGQY